MASKCQWQPGAGDNVVTPRTSPRGRCCWHRDAKVQPSRLDLGQAFPQDGPHLQPHGGHLLPVPSATVPLSWGISPQRLPRHLVLCFTGTQTKTPGDSSLYAGRACAICKAEPVQTGLHGRGWHPAWLTLWPLEARRYEDIEKTNQGVSYLHS